MCHKFANYTVFLHTKRPPDHYILFVDCQLEKFEIFRYCVYTFGSTLVSKALLTSAMTTKLLFVVLLFNTIYGWGIVDWAKDTVDDVTDTVTDGVTDGWNALSNAVTDAADETTAFFTSLADIPEIADIITSIQKVVTLVVDDIAEAIENYDEATWKKLVKDAKYVIYNLPSKIKQYVATGTHTILYPCAIDK